MDPSIWGEKADSSVSRAKNKRPHPEWGCLLPKPSPSPPMCFSVLKVSPSQYLQCFSKIHGPFPLFLLAFPCLQLLLLYVPLTVGKFGDTSCRFCHNPTTCHRIKHFRARRVSEMALEEEKTEAQRRTFTCLKSHDETTLESSQVFSLLCHFFPPLPFHYKNIYRALFRDQSVRLGKTLQSEDTTSVDRQEKGLGRSN